MGSMKESTLILLFYQGDYLDFAVLSGRFPRLHCSVARHPSADFLFVCFVSILAGMIASSALL